MNYSRDAVVSQRRSSNKLLRKAGAKSLLILFEGLIVAFLLGLTIVLSIMLGAVKGIIEQASRIEDIDISPKGLESTIYDAAGNVTQTLVGSGANRTLVTYDQLPQDLIDAFICAEDERFLQHSGVDMRGIFRAVFEAVRSHFQFSQGASTITQQLIKNNVFGGGQEKTTGARFIRKIQEQYLAIELEKTMSKEAILENYLNTINLGSNCLGVQKAAERYFKKNVSDLTLSECVTIAAITQNPYGYNPIRFPVKNSERVARILEIMQRNGYITEAEKEAVLADNVYERIAKNNEDYQTEKTVYSYFNDRLIRDVLRDLQLAGYTYDEARDMVYSGGLQIYSTQDPLIQGVVDKEANDPANYEGILQKYSFTYSLRITHSDNSVSSYDTRHIRSFAGRTYLEFETKEEISQLAEAFKASVMTDTDAISYESVDISLQPQLSITVIDQETGQVKALMGGRGEKTASLSLNRATNTFRQPGSTFKVLASFAPALENGDTLATVFYDAPYTTYIDGEAWSPRNWYSKKRYAGFSTIRQAITYSMNIVAVKCLVDEVGSSTAFNYLESFGINTLIPETAETIASGQHDVRATLALGGVTQGVTNMQLTAAYAALANNGIYKQPILYTRIVDSNGQLILSNVQDTHRVVSEETAFLLTSAMQDSLEDTRLNDLFPSSSPEAKPENLPAAGKSGTTTSYNDLWFVGYTPYYTMGVWSGFDDNAKFEDTDNRAFHKMLWKKIMEEITADKEYRDFTVPPNIVECRICTKSGMLAGSACTLDDRDVIRTEYFAAGTEPTTICKTHIAYETCAVSHLLPSAYCKDRELRLYINVPEDIDEYTDDQRYTNYPEGFCGVCEQHLIPSGGNHTNGEDTSETPDE